MPVQYLTMMRKLFVSRDLTSYSNQGQKVIPRIVAGTPITLSLAAGAIVIWIAMSFLFALLGAIFRGRLVDHVILVVSLLFVSIPVYWLGQMANLVTQERFHDTFLFSWVPPPGYVPISAGVASWAEHLVVPWIVLAAFYVGWYARVLRANLIETDSEQFIRTARSKGIPGVARAAAAQPADVPAHVREPVQTRSRAAARRRCAARRGGLPGCPASAC